MKYHPSAAQPPQCSLSALLSSQCSGCGRKNSRLLPLGYRSSLYLCLRWPPFAPVPKLTLDAFCNCAHSHLATWLTPRPRTKYHPRPFSRLISGRNCWCVFFSWVLHPAFCVTTALHLTLLPFTTGQTCSFQHQFLFLYLSQWVVTACELEAS